MTDFGVKQHWLTLTMSTKSGLILITLYIIVGIVGFEGWLNFNYDSPESWYARSGALLTLIGLYAELKIVPEAKAVVDETKNIPDALKHANRSLRISQRIAHGSVIYGTLVWSYGDLLYPWLQEHNLFNLYGLLS